MNGNVKNSYHVREAFRQTYGMLPYIIGPGKGAYYRNQNVRCDVDFIANTKATLGTGSAIKGWEFYL